MKTFSKLFYKLRWYKLSRKCDEGTYLALRLKDIQIKLEAIADTFALIGAVAKMGEQHEKNTTAQEE